MKGKTLVIALGGNALQMQGEAPTISNQNKNVRVAAKHIAKLIEKGYNVVVSHGNGPQVGRLLIQQAKADSEETPAFPFDQCSALSQASIGYSIQQILKEELENLGIKKEVSTVITQTLVDKNDEAFNNPTKPVGPFYTEEEAKRKFILGEKYINDAERGYRQVVPSPKPQEILEEHIIEEASKNNVIVCCGGGGIPVVKDEGKIHGTPAVIDKDRASSLLAQNIKADKLIILTAVSEAKINYGKENEKSLHKISTEELKKYMSEFAEGSMKPKIESCIEFTENTGNESIITTLDKVVEALETEAAGTIIYK